MQLVILFNLVCWSSTCVKSKLLGEAKQNNLPPECGQPIDRGDYQGQYTNLNMAGYNADTYN
jgi:hypothetical protein